MTSVGSSTRQVNANDAYFIPLANIVGKVYAYNPPTSSGPAFSTAQWAGLGSLSTSHNASSLASAGAGLLRDLGKTVISANRTFRKVQLVVSTTSTFGVGGGQNQTGSAPYVEDYLTGYNELGFEGAGGFTAVAKYGR